MNKPVWIPTTEELPDDLAEVWISDGKLVAISQYMHAQER